MEYLNAAVTLKSLINETNSTLLEMGESISLSPNHMMIKHSTEDTSQKVIMETFSDAFVKSTLDKRASDAFVITDFVSMEQNGKEMTYILLKGYSNKMEKGMVFFQPINKETFEPIGPLQFSNMEDNPFYTVAVSDVEESSCNAMETDKDKEDKVVKNIVFLIGHMDEDRIVYDIERLIIDTVNNMSKHVKAKFHFIIHIASFGKTATHKLRAEVLAIEKFITENIYPEYPNSTFEFAYEKDGGFEK